MTRVDKPRGEAAGFTLLEVLVAIAILGLGLTMLLSSQVGLFSGASRGEHISVATNLARCKMGELEVDLLKKGYPLTDTKDEGRCCGDEDEPGYECAWKIERIELPPVSAMQDGGTADGGGISALMNLGMAASGSGASALGPLAGSGITGVPSAFTGTNGQPPTLQGIAEGIGQGAAAAGIGPLVMGMVYPSLKPMLEASIRKVSVQVKWKEGVKQRDLSVTQYVTDPQQGGLGDGGLMGEGGLLSGLGGLLGGATTGAAALGAQTGAATAPGFGSIVAPGVQR